MATIAQWERRAISERTRAALRALRAQGKATGRPAVADDPDLTERIRHLREDRGLTLRQIADHLNAAGVPTLRGAARWTHSSVQTAAGYRRPTRRRKTITFPDATRR